MFMSIVLDIKADASLEITASHHPYQRNGLKFFTKNGGLEGSDVKDILHIAYSAESGSKEGSVINYDFMTVYCEHLKNRIIDEAADGEKPLENLKISVDAGNGVGGFYAEKVLKPLGADISASQFLESRTECFRIIFRILKIRRQLLLPVKWLKNQILISDLSLILM